VSTAPEERIASPFAIGPLTNRPVLGLLAVAIALVVATWIAAHSWERVRTRPPDRTIQVTGSAKKRIVSDLIEWSAGVTTEDKDRTVASQALHGHVDKVLAYLESQGVKKEEIQVSAVSTEELVETEYVGTGDDRIQREISKGYQAQQSVRVRSTDVARVERVSREVTQLLETGVPISSGSPSYYYTKLGELKIEMLAEASKDARTRAENMTRSAGGASLGPLREADMGIINVNPANSTGTSWEGNNDTESLEKDIMTIVHVTYELR
jgi:uncharacterized protein